MRNQGQLLLGAAIILVGILFLIGNIFDVSIWTYCWPLAFIFIGVWLLVQPRIAQRSGSERSQTRLLGNIRRRGVWTVMDEDIWVFVGDVKLDMTQAEIPPGETRLRLFGFIGDVEVELPADVAVSVSSTAFLSEVEVLDHKQERFLSPVQAESPDYATAERRVRLELTYFITDLEVWRQEAPAPAPLEA